MNNSSRSRIVANANNVVAPILLKRNCVSFFFKDLFDLSSVKSTKFHFVQTTLVTLVTSQRAVEAVKTAAASRLAVSA
jgi:hypothetical protein